MPDKQLQYRLSCMLHHFLRERRYHTVQHICDRASYYGAGAGNDFNFWKCFALACEGDFDYAVDMFTKMSKLREYALSASEALKAIKAKLGGEELHKQNIELSQSSQSRDDGDNINDTDERLPISQTMAIEQDAAANLAGNGMSNDGDIIRSTAVLMYTGNLEKARNRLRLIKIRTQAYYHIEGWLLLAHEREQTEGQMDDNIAPPPLSPRAPCRNSSYTSMETPYGAFKLLAYREAESSFQKALDMDKLQSSMEQNTNLGPECAVGLAKIYQLRGRWKEAVSLLESISSANSWFKVSEVCTMWLSVAVCKWGEAVKIAQDLIDVEEVRLDARLVLALHALAKPSPFGEAEKHIYSVKELLLADEPKTIGVWLEIIRALSRTCSRRNTVLEAVLELANGIIPKAEPLPDMSMAQYLAPPKTTEHLDNITSGFQIQLSSVYAERSLVYAFLGNTCAALADAKMALYLYPESSEAYESLCYSLIKHKSLSEGGAALNRAVLCNRGGPKSAFSWYLRYLLGRSHSLPNCGIPVELDRALLEQKTVLTKAAGTALFSVLNADLLILIAREFLDIVSGPYDIDLQSPDRLAIGFLNGTNPETITPLGKRILIKCGSVLRRIERFCPGHPDCLILQGRQSLLEKDFLNCRQKMEQLERCTGYNAAAHIILARNCELAGDPSAGLAHLQIVISEAPEIAALPCISVLKAHLQAKSNEWSSALLTLQSEVQFKLLPPRIAIDPATRIAPPDPKDYASCTFEWVFAQQLFIKLLHKRKKHRSVEKQLRVLRQHTVGTPHEERVHIFSASIAIEKNLIEDAKQSLLKVSQSSSEYGNAQLMLAKIYLDKERDFGRHSACIRSVLGRDHTPISLSNVANAFLQADAVDDAVDVMQLAYQLFPSDDQVALSFCKNGRIKEKISPSLDFSSACAFANYYVAQKHTSPSLRLEFANTLFRLQKYKEVIHLADFVDTVKTLMGDDTTLVINVQILFLKAKALICCHADIERAVDTLEGICIIMRGVLHGALHEQSTNLRGRICKQLLAKACCLLGNLYSINGKDIGRGNKYFQEAISVAGDEESPAVFSELFSTSDSQHVFERCKEMLTNNFPPPLTELHPLLRYLKSLGALTRCSQLVKIARDAVKRCETEFQGQLECGVSFLQGLICKWQIRPEAATEYFLRAKNSPAYREKALQQLICIGIDELCKQGQEATVNSTLGRRLSSTLIQSIHSAPKSAQSILITLPSQASLQHRNRNNKVEYDVESSTITDHGRQHATPSGNAKLLPFSLNHKETLLQLTDELHLISKGTDLLRVEILKQQIKYFSRDKKEMEEASKNIRACLQQAPNYIPALLLSAKISLDRGQTGRAQSRLQRIKTLAYTHSSKAKKNDSGESPISLLGHSRIPPGNYYEDIHEAMILLSEILIMKKRPDAAVEILETCEMNDRSCYKTQFLLATAKEKQHREEAAHHYAQAWKRSYGCPGVAYGYALNQLQLGKVHRAMKLLSKLDATNANVSQLLNKAFSCLGA